jgi:NADPH:quinone reductase
MRALRYHSLGKPREVLQVDDLPSPAPGRGEVLVRLSHRPINPADLHAILGSYGKMPQLPAVGGHEGTGTITALGDGVEGLAIGQRVVPMGVEGTWREEVAVPAEACFAVPAGVPEGSAAQLFVNPLTAALMLDELDLPAGAWLLQTAGTSQVGRIVVQLARQRGIRTISIVRRASAVDELAALGGDEFIVADVEADARNVRNRVFALTDGRGASGGLDGVAGKVGGLASRCLAPGATMLVYGGLSGNPLAVEAGTLIFRHLTVRGFWRTGWFDRHTTAETRARLAPLAEAVASGALRLPVAATYDLAEFRDAIEHSRQPGLEGKVLLTG